MSVESDATTPEPIGSQGLPEPEGWVARAIIDCLREWHASWLGRPMVLSIEDIDYLAKWADDLHKSWVVVDECMKRNRITVIQYPVQISEHRNST
jgi:hypothetical protein